MRVLLVVADLGTVTTVGRAGDTVGSGVGSAGNVRSTGSGGNTGSTRSAERHSGGRGNEEGNNREDLGVLHFDVWVVLRKGEDVY